MHSSLTSVLDGVSGQLHTPTALPLRRKALGTRLLGGCLGTKAGLDPFLLLLLVVVVVVVVVLVVVVVVLV